MSDQQAVVCPQCGAENPAGSRVCRANASCGSFLPGNEASRRTGIYSHRPPPELKARAESLMAGVASDLGGAADLTTLQRHYVERIGETDVLIRLLVNNIETHGLFTSAGRVREVYDKLLAGMAAFDRYAQRLGLERRARPVNPLDVVRAAVEEANKP